MPTVEIPLQARPQTFSVSLDGTQYACKLYWLKPGQHWVLDIANAQGKPIINGIPLFVRQDLIDQYSYLKPYGVLFCLNDYTADMSPPTYTNIGSNCHVYYQGADAANA